VKFKAKTKDCHLIVRVKLKLKEKINENELVYFGRNPRGFLKPSIIKKNKIEYVGPIGISLNERLKKPISKYDFLCIIEHTIVAMQKIYVNKLFLNKMILNINNIYINEVTKEVQFIYIPLLEVKEQADLVKFVEEIIYRIIPETPQDSEGISNFTYFFRGLKRFDAEAIEKYILGEDAKIVNKIKKYNDGQSGVMLDKHYKDEKTEPSKASDDEETGLLDTEETGLLEKEEETGLLNAEEEEGTALLNGGTVSSYAEHFPTLLRVMTDETISINKPVFRIGKEKSYVDFFVANNKAVSRSHADVIKRGQRYFIIDLNSKNHTYINGQMLPINNEVEIHDGDKLTLADEEFIFHI